MRILGLDQSRYHTGWALMADGVITSGGVINVPAKAAKTPQGSVLHQTQALTAAGVDWDGLLVTLESVPKPRFTGGDRPRGNPVVSLAETLGAWRMWLTLRGVTFVLQGAQDVRSQLRLPKNSMVLTWAMYQYPRLPWRRDAIKAAADRNMDMAMACGHAETRWQVHQGHGYVKVPKARGRR